MKMYIRYVLYAALFTFASAMAVQFVKEDPKVDLWTSYFFGAMPGFLWGLAFGVYVFENAIDKYINGAKK